jgi:hypothetical protein
MSVQAKPRTSTYKVGFSEIFVAPFPAVSVMEAAAPASSTVHFPVDLCNKIGKTMAAHALSSGQVFSGHHAGPYIVDVVVPEPSNSCQWRPERRALNAAIFFFGRSRTSRGLPRAWLAKDVHLFAWQNNHMDGFSCAASRRHVLRTHFWLASGWCRRTDRQRATTSIPATRGIDQQYILKMHVQKASSWMVSASTHNPRRGKPLVSTHDSGLAQLLMHAIDLGRTRVPALGWLTPPLLPMPTSDAAGPYYQRRGTGPSQWCRSLLSMVWHRSLTVHH